MSENRIEKEKKEKIGKYLKHNGNERRNREEEERLNWKKKQQESEKQKDLTIMKKKIRENKNISTENKRRVNK